MNETDQTKNRSKNRKITKKKEKYRKYDVRAPVEAKSQHI